MNHPANDPEDKWRHYERTPIRTSHHTVILIQLFQMKDHWDDMWMHDRCDVQRADYDVYQKAAEQFKLQLEGHDCIAFWQAIREVANKEIEIWEMAKAAHTP